MKKEDIPRIEFIGLEVKIDNSPDKGFIGLEGIVVDETKNMFRIRKKDGKEVWVPKRDTWFVFKFRDNFIKIYGNLILTQPHKRIKKRYPKKHAYRW